jgi:XTP/dITP diphosphohydrolase
VRHADDPQPVIADGRWDGVIVDTPRGENGFGYDPHFLIPSLGKTTAELTPAEKNARSHRGQALRALVEKLR